MKTDVDHADAEVQGLARLLPTTLAKSLLFAVFALPIAVFQVIRGNPEWFGLRALPPVEQTMAAALAGVAFSWLPLVGLVVELCVILMGRKHGRIVHYTNVHPHMSFRWLMANAQASHYLALSAVLAVGFVLGLCATRA